MNDHRIDFPINHGRKYALDLTRPAQLKGVVEQMTNLARRIYKALHLSGYARMDFRLRSDGSLFVLEANANPNLSKEEDFADSARSVGMSYDELLSKILAHGLSYQAAWRLYES